MIEQRNRAVTFYFQFYDTGAGKTGLTVTVNVTRRPAGEVIATGETAAEVSTARHPGLYELTITDTVDAGDYVATAHTDDVSVDSQDVPALWSIGRAGVDALDQIATGRITVSYPILASNTITLIRGDDYTDTRPIEWVEVASAGWPASLSGASIVFTATPVSAGAVFTKAGEVVSDDKVRVELTHTETATLNRGVGAYVYGVTATLPSEEVITLARGRVTVE